MPIDSQHLHIHHNPEQPYHEPPRVTALKTILEEKGIDYIPAVEEYSLLSNNELAEIITECDEGLVQNIQYIERLNSSDYIPDEKLERIKQAERASHYLTQRKQIAETVIELNNIMDNKIVLK